MKHLRSGLAVLAVMFTIFVAVVVIKDLFSVRREAQDNENIATPAGTSRSQFKGTYPVHKDVTASVFWVGEQAGNSNDFISNKASAWDESWMEHFGGEDSPDNRNGYLPNGFTPKENPFYFALPYNDFDKDGNRKPQAFDIVYWAEDKKWSTSESICKNQWIKISKDGLSVYAQWEDVGPFEENDGNYVFGKADPKNTEKSGAGLDVSPAVKDYLKLSGIDTVNWQFVAENDIPDGPWKRIVTTRNGNSTGQ